MITYETREDIPKELLEYCEEWSTGLRLIHPFRYDDFVFRSETDILSEIDETDILSEIDETEALFQREIAAGKWDSALERVTHFGAKFQYINSYIEPELPKDLCGNRKYWSLVSTALRSSRNHWRATDQILEALNCSRGEKTAGLNGDDLEAFNALSDTVIGWRGVMSPTEGKAYDYIKGGFSWSVDRCIAQSFARAPMEIDETPYIAWAEFEKHEIEAYFPSNREGEIVVRPSAERQINLMESK